MGMGRPTDFSENLADLICERLADGESLRSICRDEGMPGTSTVCRWLAANEEFREQYAISREMQADAFFDDILDIADGKRAVVEGVEPDVQRDRLAVDARKWMAGKLKGKYSDKTKHELSGPDGGAIPFTGLEVTIVDPEA